MIDIHSIFEINRADIDPDPRGRMYMHQPAKAREAMPTSQRAATARVDCNANAAAQQSLRSPAAAHPQGVSV